MADEGKQAPAQSENGRTVKWPLFFHSAGSCKSNFIAWLVHRIVSLYTENDEKVFDSIIVVTDWGVLHQQLQNTIYHFELKQSVVQKSGINSIKLAKARQN